MRINVYIINAILLFFSSILLTTVKEHGIVIKTLSKTRLRLCNLQFILFWGCLLCCEYGLRGEITADNTNYKTWFELFNDYRLIDALHYKNVEKGFALFNAFIGIFTNDYQHYIFALGFFSVSFFMISIWKNAENKWLPVFVFIATGFFYGGWNLCSQFLAASIFSLAVEYIYKKEPVKYFLVVLLAFFIHKSAIIMIPLYFVLTVNISDKKWYKTVKYVVIACVAMTPVISGIAIAFSRFLYNDVYSEASGMFYQWTYIVKCLSLVAIIIYYRKCFDFSDLRDRVVYFGSLLYGVVILWGSGMALIQRFSYYLIIFPMIAVSIIYVRRKSIKLSVLFGTYFFLMQVGWFDSEYFLCFN